MSSTLTRSQVAQMVDHTLLKPEATLNDAKSTVREGKELGVLAVCLSPSMIPIDAEGLRLCVVSGFPSGKHQTLVKAAESRLAVESGAVEVDMVIDVGEALDGNFGNVQRDITTVREAIGPDVLLKVIVESAALLSLSDNGPALVADVCRVAEKSGANFVKTSTGFHPAGGASVEAVTIMRNAVSPEIGVKASGGIRDSGFAAQLIEAGADRLGLSGSRAVLAGFPE